MYGWGTLRVAPQQRAQVSLPSATSRCRMYLDASGVQDGGTPVASFQNSVVIVIEGNIIFMTPKESGGQLRQRVVESDIYVENGTFMVQLPGTDTLVAARGGVQEITARGGSFELGNQQECGPVSGLSLLGPSQVAMCGELGLDVLDSREGRVVHERRVKGTCVDASGYHVAVGGRSDVVLFDTRSGWSRPIVRLPLEPDMGGARQVVLCGASRVFMVRTGTGMLGGSLHSRRWLLGGVPEGVDVNSMVPQDPSQVRWAPSSLPSSGPLTLCPDSPGSFLMSGSSPVRFDVDPRSVSALTAGERVDVFWKRILVPFQMDRKFQGYTSQHCCNFGASYCAHVMRSETLRDSVLVVDEQVPRARRVERCTLR